MMNLTHAESAWGSLVIGWPLGLFLFFIQFPLLVTYQHCKHFITKGIYYVFFQSYIILGVVATIASFRANWYLLDSYFITCDAVSSQMIGMVLGITIFSSLKTMSCLQPGVSSDNPSNGIVIGFHLTSFWYISQQKNTEETESTICKVKNLEPVIEINKSEEEAPVSQRKNSFLRHII